MKVPQRHINKNQTILQILTKLFSHTSHKYQTHSKENFFHTTLRSLTNPSTKSKILITLGLVLLAGEEDDFVLPGGFLIFFGGRNKDYLD